MGLAGRGLARWRGYREWEGFTSESGLDSQLIYQILPLENGTVLEGPGTIAYVDYFFDRAFDDAGKEFKKTLMDQLLTQTDSSIVASQEERKSFDANESL